LTPIGGYFELELPRFDFPHADGLLLSSGRACLEVVLRHRRPARVHVPRYTCDVVVEPMARLGIEVALYPISADLRPDPLPQLGADEMLVANNYFGLQDAYCTALAERFGDRLIVDCSQAFHAPPVGHGAYSFYTPRKFCGVADGGILLGGGLACSDLPRDRSWERSSHLLRRLDEGARAGYATFQHNDASLTGQPAMRMSHLTHRLLQACDHAEARRRRHANFVLLHEALGARNAFSPPLSDSFACPMVYPYRSADPGLRGRLIEAGIFVATYWPNVREWCAPDSEEFGLMTELLPLPIDQRYGRGDMRRILAVLA
jgi:hypothetical protein